jgi:hypothetical protein
MKKIELGATSAASYFALNAAPAYSRFQRVSNRENAMSLASVLWDTAGWLWSDCHPGIDRRKHQRDADAFDKDLFNRCPDLKLIRDLAEATKHGGELSRKSVTVTGLSGSGSPGGTLFASTPFGGMVESEPECRLQIEHDGKSRDTKEALATAYRFLLPGAV